MYDEIRLRGQLDTFRALYVYTTPFISFDQQGKSDSQQCQS